MFKQMFQKQKGGKRNISSLKLTEKAIQKLLKRIKQINLYAHSYAFKLNFKHGNFDVYDLLNFASKNKLRGICININYGSNKSLRQKSEKELKKIKLYAKKLRLKINLDISNTSKKEVDCVVKIAKILCVNNVRIYIRYGGNLFEIIKKGIEDLKYIAKVAKDNDLQFVLEQHEVLKSKELIDIIKKVNSPRIGLLFDFGNMVNANEKPLAALKTMSSYIQQVHLKGVRIVKRRFGYDQVGVLEGKDHLPQMEMIINTLMLGDKKPQVKVYGLEQEVEYYSPAFRFDNEGKNPIIPKRRPSNTSLVKNKSIQENLLLEKQNAYKQVIYIRNLIEKLKANLKSYHIKI